MASRGKLIYSAADRNKQPILEVLKQFLPRDQNLKALEVSSGTGQHAIYFAKHFPNITWQPTEISEVLLNSIRAYVTESKLSNVLDPFLLDATDSPLNIASGTLPQSYYDVIVCINLFHISSPLVSEGFFNIAGYLLKQNGLLFTYGPYMVNGVITPDSNVSFDAMLRARDSQHGLRDICWVSKLAEKNGLKLEQSIEMPANNKTLIFNKL